VRLYEPPATHLPSHMSRCRGKVVLVEKVSRVVVRIYILEEESRDEADARGIESESPHMRPVVVSHLAVSR